MDEKKLLYLSSASKLSLQEVLIRSLAERQNGLKEMAELIEEIVDAEATARFAEYKLADMRAVEERQKIA